MTVRILNMKKTNGPLILNTKDKRSQIEYLK